MASNRVFVSPGVYTTEKDLSFVTSNVGVTTAGIAGETVKGPAFQPIFVRDYNEFTSFFGGQNPEKFKATGIPKFEAPYIAKSYLSQSNQMYVTRVLGLSGYDAGQAWGITIDAALDSTTTGTTAGGGAFTLDYSANTITGELTSVVISDPLVQSLYDAGLLDDELSGLGAAATGATFSITDPIYEKSGVTFSGASFDLTVTGTTSGVTISEGTTTGTSVHYSGTSYSDVENMLVALVRSRGQYGGDETIIFEFSGSTAIDFDLTYTDALNDPYAKFVLSGTSEVQGAVSYDLSFDTAKKNYITKVIGVSEKDSQAGIFAEEVYQDLLDDLIAEGKVKGIKLDLIKYDNAFNNYKEEYQAAVTPYLVSEVRGNELLKLFRFWTISDGNYANKEFKISVQNIKPDAKEFDVVIRRFADSDANPSILESFSRCSMDPASNNYIARKIGTVDGVYASNSTYVLIELSDDADTSEAFPAGFLGTQVRDYTSSSQSTVQTPDLVYRTEYKVSDKKRKVYLGLSDTAGIDQDFFDYKGLDNSDDTWTGATKGFHMDSGATSMNIGNESFDFSVGNAEFRDDLGLSGTDYEKLDSRKFTFAPSGGFDGWDIYRDQRTNEDTYTVNGAKGALSNNVFTARTTSNDENGSTSDYYAYFEGIRTFSNPESIDINVFATPGIDTDRNSNLIEEAIEMIETERCDSLYVVTTPDSSGSNTISAGDAVSKVDGLYDSSYTATYWPWVQVNDTENNQFIYLPPTRDVLRNIALTDSVAYPWYAAAGTQRGKVDAIKARTKLTQDDREVLYAGRLNPVMTSTSVGINIMGNKTMQIAESALDSVSVRRLLLQTRKLISAVSLSLLFQPNDSIVRSQFLALVNPILDNIRKERGITQFKVVLDDNADRKELVGQIFIQPTDALEVIRVEFNVTSAGASFDNI